MPTGDHDERQFHAIKLSYVAAHGAPNADQPTHEDLGLERVLEVADRCWNFRGHADYIAAVDCALAEDPWRELCGLAGTIGESLMLVAASEIEVEWHRRARAIGDLPSNMKLGQRFLSEANANAVISIGHRLANLIARALVLDPQLRAAAAKSKNPNIARMMTALTPFSDDRHAWISLDDGNTRTLRKIAKCSSHSSVRSLADRLRELACGEPWRQLEQSRGEDFHRWRVESASLAGVDRFAGHLRDVHSYDGSVVGKEFGPSRTRYTLGDNKDEQIAPIVRTALDAVTSTTDSVIQSLERALEPLSHGRITSTPDGDLVVDMFGYPEWTAGECTCCSASPEGASA